MGGSNLVNSWTQTEHRVDLSQTWTKVQNIENFFYLASYLLISRGTPWVPETELHLWSHLQVFVMIILSFSYFECYSFFAIIITIFIPWMLFFCDDHDHYSYTLNAPHHHSYCHHHRYQDTLTHLESTFSSPFQVWSIFFADSFQNDSSPTSRFHRSALLFVYDICIICI